MATARPLRDVFSDVTGDEAARASDPAELLRASGHDDLPDALVAEAVTSYADTAPLEVAEHLSQFVMANSAVPGVGVEVDPSSWLQTLAGAPEALVEALDPAAAGLDEGAPEPAAAPEPAGDAVGQAYAFDLDFGLGDAVTSALDRAVDFFGPAPGDEPAGVEAFGAAATGDEMMGPAAGADEAFGVATPTEPTRADDDEDDDPDAAAL